MASSVHIIREKKLWTGLPVLSTTTTVIVVVGLRFLVTSFGASIDELSESLGLSRSRALALSPALSQLPAPRCPDSCEDIFSQLKDGPRGTGKFQSVDIQLRGEPKSGTGMSQEWAWGALAQTCVYLRRLYGETSCRIVTEEGREGRTRRGTTHSIIFEPRSAQTGEEAPCTCDTVDRVHFSFSAVAKHRLPVDNRCVWAHRVGTADPHSAACKSPSGRPVKTRAELWQCVEDNDCPIIDQRLQLAVIRDPRAVTVSAYFMHVRLQKAHGLTSAGYLDAYFMTFLKTVCMWMSVRYFLFTELLANQSLVLHYEDAVADPVEWHRRYLGFVGIRLPPEQVEEASRVASEGGSILGFHSKGLDEHPGAQSQGDSRSFRDELSNSSLSAMDDVLRTWLPDVLLEKYGVLPC